MQHILVMYTYNNVTLQYYITLLYYNNVKYDIML